MCVHVWVQPGFQIKFFKETGRRTVFDKYLSLLLLRFTEYTCLSCIFLQSKIFVTCQMMSIVSWDFSYNSSVISFTELVAGELPVETVICLQPGVSGQCPS